MKFWPFLILMCVVGLASEAQVDTLQIRKDLNILSSADMAGRGYVRQGVVIAAHFLANQFRQIGLQPFRADSGYLQPYAFGVNRFPSQMSLKVNGKKLRPGLEFIVHEGSQAYRNRAGSLREVHVSSINHAGEPNVLRQILTPGRCFVLAGWDSLTRLQQRSVARLLPRGLFIIPTKGKLTWSIATDTLSATIVYVCDTALPRFPGRIKARIDAEYVPQFQTHNVLGYVPGTEVPDSFYVFTAHFDHLGMMGHCVQFPGAMDNASGTALLLALARYIVVHPQRYSIAFLAFSGEEAGLLGSRHYVDHPWFPLKKIKMLLNIDLAGDAYNGITIVNAIEQVQAVSRLKEINEQLRLLPAINERAQAANSDHFSFSQKGVPAIFMYNNGRKPFYHDVFDKPGEIPLSRVSEWALLMLEFIASP